MEDVKQCLLKQKENSDADFLVLEGRLNSLLRKEVVDIARQLNVKRAGASKKGEIVARLLAKSRLGILAGNGDKAHEEISISYITPEISKILSSLPKFSDVFEGWSKEVGSSLENFHFVHLHAFLVESRDKTFDAKSLRAFKSLKGYTFFADGFVRNVWLKTFPDSDVVYFRSYVFHSLTVDTPLTVFVCVSKSCGDVYSAQCNCVAGLGASCNHIAALLFALERYARDSIKLLPDEPSKTSLPMSWNQPPRKIVKPSPVSDIVFTNFTYSCKSSSKEPGQLASSGFKFDPRPSQQRNLDAVLLQNLQDELNESFPESAFLSFWADIPAKPLKGVSEVSVEETLQGTVIEPLLLYVPSKSLLFASSPPVAGDELTDDECEVFVADQVIDQKTVDVVERSTRGQAGNDIWHLVRYGRLTSSRFGELLHRRETTSSTRLVTEIMGYKENTASRSRAVSWGRNNENNALKAYTITRNAAVVAPANISVHLCGLNLLATHSYIGASSDGIVFGEKDTGCVEVKCPYSIGKQPVSDMAPLDIAKRFPQFYLKRGTDGKLHLDHDHHYYAQVQGEMAVIGVSWCDFIVFTAGGLFIERIPFDNQFWLSTLLPALETFFTRHVAPEILTRRILKSLSQKSIVVPVVTTPHSLQAVIPSGPVVGRQTVDGLRHFYLPPDYCQSRLDGRNGSSACAVIAGCVVQDFLSKSLVQPFTHLHQAAVDSFVHNMRHGNALYDASPAGAKGDYLGVYDVPHLVPSIRVRPSCDFGWRNLVECADSLAKVAIIVKTEAKPAAGIVVQSPYCLSLLFNADSIAIYDSHSHGVHGAAIVSCSSDVGWDHIGNVLVQAVGQIQDAHFALFELVY